MAARAHLLIRKGRVIDPLSGRDEVADLLVEDGRLVRIGASLDAPGAELIDAEGHWVIPGLVDACVHGAAPDDVETALDEIVPILDADIFGRAAEERNVDAIRGAYQEAKRCRSHEVLTILAANAPCPRSLPALLSPVTRRLHAADALSLKRQLEACLTSVQKGLLNNPHASPEETLVLVHSVVNDGISQEERQAEYDEAVAQGHLEVNTLGMKQRGEKEMGNRVWENGW